MTTTALPTTTAAARSLQRAAVPSPTAARLRALAAVAFGVALTLAMQGYQFGQSNHTVYLIDAMRHASPDLLRNDWFATQTLQYHAAFGLLARGLMRLGVVEPAFLVGHLLLAVLLHLAWWRIVRVLGGGGAAFALSEVLFHISGAGTGLGMYQFLQDSAFLPSNVASVAFLWAVYFWIADRRAASAVMFGVAGLFHLNYAIVGPAVWVVLSAVAAVRERRRPTTMEWFGAIAMFELCLMNIVPALIAIRQRTGRMPLEEFVDIYVHVRHPHHYAPLAWPAALWITFLWPIPFAWLYWRRRHDDNDAVEQARRVVDVIVLLLAIAFLGAGVWYVSETLVQLSLWRFSVVVKLLTCVGAALWLTTVASARGARWIMTASAVAGIVLIAACLVRGPYLGFLHVTEDDADYLAACDWIRANTPADAVFLVPPDEEAFRLRAQRAIVVNFKCVPQLSGELGEWRDRLSAVIAMDIRGLPATVLSFDRTRGAIRAAYERRPPAQLAKVAQRYNARYLLVGHSLGDEWEPRRVAAMDDATSAYFLYDLQR
jgi:hypothetical protein